MPICLCKLLRHNALLCCSQRKTPPRGEVFVFLEQFDCCVVRWQTCFATVATATQFLQLETFAKERFSTHGVALLLFLQLCTANQRSLRSTLCQRLFAHTGWAFWQNGSSTNSKSFPHFPQPNGKILPRMGKEGRIPQSVPQRILFRQSPKTCCTLQKLR